jgi:hypothetical protein
MLNIPSLRVTLEPAPKSSLRSPLMRHQVHLVAHVFQSLNEVRHQPFGVELIEIVGPRILIGGFVPEHMVDDNEQSMTYGDQRTLLSPASRKPARVACRTEGRGDSQPVPNSWEVHVPLGELRLLLKIS